jgi:PHD/YefM family antitoxin component YafN of YafNO toxin-antitoxin module
MANKTTQDVITIPKALIQRKKGIAILPLEEYEKIKEDLEMLQSKKLAKDIEKARKEKKTISLEKLLKEHGL